VFAGQEQQLDIRFRGIEVLENYARSGRGCLLIGAHLGSFEIIRALGLLQSGYRIKALVYAEGTPLISSIYQKLNPELFKDIIYMGNAGSLLGLDEHARRGGMIALLGDRSMQNNKRTRCLFFGEPAWFPEAPARLSRILDMPLVLFFCLQRGDGRYEVCFEHLADPPQVAGNELDAAYHSIMQRYAERLQHYCRMAPFNWFNFYDFWQSD
jgi:predicted LPLAT superfamily acyltransferase